MKKKAYWSTRARQERRLMRAFLTAMVAMRQFVKEAERLQRRMR